MEAQLAILGVSARRQLRHAGRDSARGVAHDIGDRVAVCGARFPGCRWGSHGHDHGRRRPAGPGWRREARCRSGRWRPSRPRLSQRPRSGTRLRSSDQDGKEASLGIRCASTDNSQPADKITYAGNGAYSIQLITYPDQNDVYCEGPSTTQNFGITINASVTLTGPASPLLYRPRGGGRIDQAFQYDLNPGLPASGSCGPTTPCSAPTGPSSASTRVMTTRSGWRASPTATGLSRSRAQDADVDQRVQPGEEQRRPGRQDGDEVDDPEAAARVAVGPLDARQAGDVLDREDTVKNHSSSCERRRPSARAAISKLSSMTTATLIRISQMRTRSNGPAGAGVGFEDDPVEREPPAAGGRPKRSAAFSASDGGGCARGAAEVTVVSTVAPMMHPAAPPGRPTRLQRALARSNLKTATLASRLGQRAHDLAGLNAERVEDRQAVLPRQDLEVGIRADADVRRVVPLVGQRRASPACGRRRRAGGSASARSSGS